MPGQAVRSHEATGDVRRREVIASFFEAVQAGDATVLHEVLTPDAITRWPQSHERITGAMSCIRVYENYPGGPPPYRIERIGGAGDRWVAELVAQYDDERWYIVSLIEFEGWQIARLTDYFGPAFPAPEWRSEWVQIEDAASAARIA